MPVPPSYAPTQIATPMLGREFAPGQTQSQNPSANPNPQNQLVGVDAVKFTLQGNPSAPTSQTLTFANLAVRNINDNPLLALQTSQRDLWVDASSHLLLVCHVQGTFGQGVIVSVAPQAITSSGIVTPGPFLGSETFRTFQAVVTVSASPIVQTVNGSVVAHLYLASGSSGN